ncbi:MAG: copper oxidase [Nannocystaceae bacterium]|nr:copper oxidase [Deltaproteobacteria bacterium]MBK8717641.1 copper oxidase [Deltaproteobacteria bacterium]MBP7285754.1 copper oxidase [Nannocystaceae bacterium]
MTRLSLSRRRALFAGAAATGTAALVGASTTQAAPADHRWAKHYSGPPARGVEPPAQPGADYRPTTTPGGATLPFVVKDGVKVFHLIAEEVEHAFTPTLKARCWGYNGRVHGPTIEAVEGDRVRVYVTNRLGAPTTVHWHGIYLPCGMDGVGGLTQRTIAPGETFRYEWTFRQSGTFMYHSHHDEMTQMAMGMMGMIIVHPRRPPAGYEVDRDFVLMLSEWKIAPGAKRPDPNEMSDFNLLTMNAHAYPATAPLVCQTGDRVRIRIGNLSAMDHHPIHLHGYYFKVVATDGGRLPASAQWPETTVLVPTGSTRDIEFVADAPGDWAMHCHMTHHVMNQMGHGLPNMIGVKTKAIAAKGNRVVEGYMPMGEHGMGEMADMEAMGMKVPDNSIPMLGGKGPHDVITMGGMFTILKVRDRLEGEGDPGWYAMPPGTMATVAKPEELARDGIDV